MNEANGGGDREAFTEYPARDPEIMDNRQGFTDSPIQPCRVSGTILDDRAADQERNWLPFAICGLVLSLFSGAGAVVLISAVAGRHHPTPTAAWGLPLLSLAGLPLDLLVWILTRRQLARTRRGRMDQDEETTESAVICTNIAIGISLCLFAASLFLLLNLWSVA